MSLQNNADYEVISNAEISSVINKYSPDMTYMTISQILKNKGVPQINPMGNLVASYESNFKFDLKKYSQFQSDMLERRAELYSSIIDMVCSFHNLSYQELPNTDVYSSAFYIYQFLVSDFYHSVISFFVNYLKREAVEICKMLETQDIAKNPMYQYAKKRYGSKSDLSIIHTNLSYVLDNMQGFDITMEDIIDNVYVGSFEAVNTANFLKSALRDNGDFFKTFYVPAVSGFQRSDAVTNIRLQLLPPSANIKDYITTVE